MSNDFTGENWLEPRGRLSPTRVNVGLIIPAVNTMSEPQLAHFCPRSMGLYATRLRISGKWKKPFSDISTSIREAAALLSDTRPDLIIFHCTGTSMQEGPDGDAFICNLIRNETGIEAMTTGGAVIEAMKALKIHRPILISPYVQATNNREIAYLGALGIRVVHDVALGIIGGHLYPTVTPQEWVRIALANDCAEGDGYFLSCTNTTQIEAIDAIERATGKPVVNSNQSVVWASIQRLRASSFFTEPAPRIGRLMAETHAPSKCGS